MRCRPGRTGTVSYTHLIDHYDAVMENADSSCEAFLSVYDNLLLEYERIYNLVSKL